MDKTVLFCGVLLVTIAFSECASSRRRLFRQKRSSGYRHGPDRQGPDRSYGSDYHPKPHDGGDYQTYDAQPRQERYYPKSRSAGYESGYPSKSRGYPDKGRSRHSPPDDHDYGDSRYNGYSDNYAADGYGDSRKDGYGERYGDRHSVQGPESYYPAASYDAGGKGFSDYPVIKHGSSYGEPPREDYKDYGSYDGDYGDSAYGSKQGNGGYSKRYDGQPPRKSYEPDRYGSAGPSYQGPEPSGYHDNGHEPSGYHGNSHEPSDYHVAGPESSYHGSGPESSEYYGDDGYGKNGDHSHGYGNSYDEGYGKSDSSYGPPSESKSYGPYRESDHDYSRPESGYKKQGQDYDRSNYDLSAGDFAKQGHYGDSYHGDGYHDDHGGGYHDPGYHGYKDHHGGYEKGGLSCYQCAYSPSKVTYKTIKIPHETYDAYSADYHSGPRTTYETREVAVTTDGGWDRCKGPFSHTHYGVDAWACHQQGPFSHAQAKHYGVDVWACHKNCYVRVDYNGNLYRGCYKGEFGVNPNWLGCHYQADSLYCFCEGSKCNNGPPPLHRNADSGYHKKK